MSVWTMERLNLAVDDTLTCCMSHNVQSRDDLRRYNVLVIDKLVHMLATVQLLDHSEPNTMRTRGG